MIKLKTLSGCEMYVRRECVAAFWKVHDPNSPSIKSCILISGCADAYHLATEYGELRDLMNGERPGGLPPPPPPPGPCYSRGLYG